MATTWDMHDVYAETWSENKGYVDLYSLHFTVGS